MRRDEAEQRGHRPEAEHEAQTAGHELPDADDDGVLGNELVDVRGHRREDRRHEDDPEEHADSSEPANRPGREAAHGPLVEDPGEREVERRVEPARAPGEARQADDRERCRGLRYAAESCPDQALQGRHASPYLAHDGGQPFRVAAGESQDPDDEEDRRQEREQPRVRQAAREERAGRIVVRVEDGPDGPDGRMTGDSSGHAIHEGPQPPTGTAQAIHGRRPASRAEVSCAGPRRDPAGVRSPGRGAVP